MIIQKFEDKESWLAARRGRITGSKLADIMPNQKTGKPKVGFYQLIADRLGIAPDDGESAMERGHRLEPEAIKEFTERMGKKVDTSLVIWSREDNEAIAVSPDGSVEGEEAVVEVKCLGSARHIEVVLNDEIPKEYDEQNVQYFIVNPNLETVYFVFYDPRVLAKPFHMITVKRADKEKQIKELLAVQRATLMEVERIVNELSDF